MSAHRTHTGHFAVVRPWPGFGSGRAGQPSCYSIRASPSPFRCSAAPTSWSN